jgi:hypothetical protein
MINLGTSVLLTAQDVYAARGNYQGGSQSVVVGENEYVAWFSNKSGNWEVLFRQTPKDMIRRSDNGTIGNAEREG